jgi:predicted DCC family thiol-disulfide oxidoreductase YuxK
VTHPYGYRGNPDVPPFPDDKGVLVFDGKCVLCTGFARYVLRHDAAGRLRLCPAQSPLGHALYRHYGLDPVNYMSNIFIEDGIAHFKSDAFIAAMAALGFPHNAMRVLRLCPRPLRDLLYDPIARHRYRWFGERDVCYVPLPQERDRFLP